MSKETLITQALEAIEQEFPVFYAGATIDLSEQTEERLNELISNPETFFKNSERLQDE